MQRNNLIYYSVVGCVPLVVWVVACYSFYTFIVFYSIV